MKSVIILLNTKSTTDVLYWTRCNRMDREKLELESYVYIVNVMSPTWTIVTGQKMHLAWLWHVLVWMRNPLFHCNISFLFSHQNIDT